MQADYYGGLTSLGGLRQSEATHASTERTTGAIFSVLESIMEAGCEYHLDSAKLRVRSGYFHHGDSCTDAYCKASSLAPYNQECIILYLDIIY